MSKPTVTEATGLVCAHCASPIGDHAFMKDGDPVEWFCCSVKCREAFDPTNISLHQFNNLRIVVGLTGKEPVSASVSIGSDKRPILKGTEYS